MLPGLPSMMSKASASLTSTITASASTVSLNDTVADVYVSSSGLKDVLYPLLLFSTVLFLPFALIRQATLDDHEEADDVFLVNHQNLWLTKSYRAFFGLVEQWSYGRILWGPWNAGTIQQRPNKRYIKRMIRAGMIPFYIQDGGVRTYQKSGWKVSGFHVTLPVYVQSKGRAYFEFAMLFPRGQRNNPIPELDKARQRFFDLLLTQEEYAVTVWHWKPADTFATNTVGKLEPAETTWLECGAQSCIKFLLPFKSDEVLQEGKDREQQMTLEDFVEGVVEPDDMDEAEEPDDVEDIVPLLEEAEIALIRIEALDYSPVALDQFIYRVATSAGIGDIWSEDELSKEVGKLLAEHNLLPAPVDKRLHWWAR